MSILTFFVRSNLQDSAAPIVIIFTEITGWFTFSVLGLRAASRALSDDQLENRSFALIMRAINAILLFGPIVAIIVISMLERGAPPR